MRATTLRRPSGPFLLPARVVLLGAGVLAVGLGLFNLLHEFHRAEVDGVYAIIALLVGAVWLGSIILAFLGYRIGVFVAATIAFIELGNTASNHFVAGPGAVGAFVKSEGLPVATVAMALLPACTLVIVSAAVAWTSPRARDQRIDTLPLLLAALVGAVLVILAATDSVRRDNFGKAVTEDGAFAAAVTATLWLVGGLMVARRPRSGTLVLALATFIVWYSFVTLHLVNGATPVTEIASKSGVIWALIAVASAVLAAASFVVALGLLALTIRRRKPSAIAA